MSETTKTPPVRHAAPARIAAICAFVLPVLCVLWNLEAPRWIGEAYLSEQYLAIALGLTIGICFLDLASQAQSRVTMIAAALAGLPGLGVLIYCAVIYKWIIAELAYRPLILTVLGTFILGLVLEGLRRRAGMTMFLLVAVFLAYALMAHLVPGALQGRRMPFERLVQYVAFDPSSVFTTPLTIGATVIVLFVFFGSVLFLAGGGTFFTDLALSLTGRARGGSAKIAVLGSALFGSISGSAVSNVVTTGVVTIPLMRRGGYTARDSGAIEAVASTGGQLAPPVMGAAAFLMAELLQMPYKNILLAAILPAAIYYLSLYVQIDFIARRDGHRSADWIENQPMRRVLREGWLALAAFVVLLGSIFAWNTRAEVAAIWALGLIIAVALGAWALRFVGVRAGPAVSPRDLAAGIAKTGGQVCDVLLICAAAGMIIGLLATTGLGFSLSLFLIQFGGQNLFGLLIITALVGIVLGLGLPTTGVYLLLATMAAPALVQLGIPSLSAHMFVFYYGMLSMITPPIALAAYAAASISGAPQIQTGVQAFKFGWIAYLLPFLFIYKPGLLMSGPWYEIAYVFVSSVAALALVSAGLIGHAVTRLSAPVRLAVVVLGVLMIAPLRQVGPPMLEFGTSALGIALIAVYAIRLRGAAPGLASAE